MNKSGIFELNGIDKSSNPAIAFNFNRTESNLNFLKESDLKEKLATANIDVMNVNHKNLTAVVGEINQGITLWKVCLLLALLFILIEVLLLRFWNT